MQRFQHSKQGSQSTTFLRTVVRVVCACGLLGGPAVAWSQSVVFINPGKLDEAYWVSAGQAMAQAAKSLGMQWQMITTERDRLKPIEVAREIASRPVAERPDYVVFSNDYSIAPSMLQILEGTGIQSFMAFSGVNHDLREQVGLAREKFPSWIGSLEPQAEAAGYLTAQALIAAARKGQVQRGPDGKIHMLVIAGDRSTPSSTARNAGMRQAVREHADVVLEQEVFGDWRHDKAQDQASVLFRRYPYARVVWAGNDLMAFGAMDAWRQLGGAPGVDAFFSGINTSDTAFALLGKGQLSALAGGHFLAGAWAMVMLFDHHRGIDFASEGLEQQRPLFMAFDAHSATRFQQRFNMQMHTLNFKPFSKHHNRAIQRYAFNVQALLH
jgi:ABC-type sugar transport system substrate-binding protein